MLTYSVQMSSYPNNIRQQYEDPHYITVQILMTTSACLPLLQQCFLKKPKYISLKVRDKVLHPHQTTGIG